jgi:putative ABC transport system permease protein
VRDYPVAGGRYFTDEENDRDAKVAVLGSGLAKDLFGADSPIGQTITVGSTKLTVIGVMASKGVVSDIDYDGRVYLPINLVFQKFMPQMELGGDRVRTIYVKAVNQDKIDSVIAQITALLALRHDVEPSKADFTVQTQQDIIATQEATTAAFRDLLAWVAGVSLLVGHRHHEHHAGVSDGTDPRDRSAAGAGGAPQRCAAAISDRGRDLEPGWWSRRRAWSESAARTCSANWARCARRSHGIHPAGAAAASGIFFDTSATRAAQLDPIVAPRRE